MQKSWMIDDEIIYHSSLSREDVENDIPHMSMRLDQDAIPIEHLYYLLDTVESIAELNSKLLQFNIDAILKETIAFVNDWIDNEGVIVKESLVDFWHFDFDSNGNCVFFINKKKVSTPDSLDFALRKAATSMTELEFIQKMKTEKEVEILLSNDRGRVFGDDLGYCIVTDIEPSRLMKRFIEEKTVVLNGGKNGKKRKN